MSKEYTLGTKEALEIIDTHLSRLPNYNPNSDEECEDKIEEGYGNALFNVREDILTQEAQKGKE